MRFLFSIVCILGILSCNHSKKIQLHVENLKSDWITNDSTRLIIEDNYLIFIKPYGDYCNFYGSYTINTDTLHIIREGRYASNRRCKNLYFNILELSNDKLVIKNLCYNKLNERDKEFLTFKKYNKLKNSERISDLEFSTNGCFGPCPIFDIKITEDSLLIIKGYNNVKHKGLYEKELNNIEYQRLNTLFNKINLTNIKQIPAYPDAFSYSFFIKSKSNRTFEGEGTYSVSNYDLDYFIRYLVFLEATSNLKSSNKRDIKFRNNSNREFMLEN